MRFPRMPEKEVRLENGAFELGGLKASQLPRPDARYSPTLCRKAIRSSRELVGRFIDRYELRNQLTHPKSVQKVRIDEVKRAIAAIIGAIDVLFQGVYPRPFPAASRGLQSRLTV